MNTKQWFGLFIVVIMVGSIVGFGSYFAGDQTGETPPASPEPGITDSTVMQMTATDVNAKVVEVISKILFSAYTNEADITVIENKIAAVQGIYKIENSGYRQADNPSFETSLVYKVEISFDKKNSSSEMISSINNATKGILFDPVFFEVVLVSVPKNLKFSNDQGFDLNYEFEEPLILAYVLPGTIKGEKFPIRIDASFTGKTMVNSFSSEIPAEAFLADFNSTVKEKLPRIVFGSFVDYSSYLDENTLKEKILSLNGIVDANVSSFKPDNYFTVFFDANDSLQQDFNSFLSDNNSFSSIEVFAGERGFSAQIYFKGENIKELENQVKTFLQGKNASGISFKEASTQAFGSIALTSSDSNKAVSGLISLLDSLNFTETQVQQEVTVFFPSFFDGFGREFVASEKTISEVFVSPSKQTGEEVLLKAQIVPDQFNRKGISSLAAAEK